MKIALREAELAYAEGEVPVGAVVVCDGHVIARSRNQTERLLDVTAHAEIVAIGAAANHLGSKYLTNCTLFVTLEPCVMCAGALAWAKLARVVFGASDLKQGFTRFGRELLHPKTVLESGIMAAACGELMTSFFQSKRIK